jgi:hypothetical protein
MVCAIEEIMLRIQSGKKLAGGTDGWSKWDRPRFDLVIDDQRAGTAKPLPDIAGLLPKGIRVWPVREDER